MAHRPMPHKLLPLKYLCVLLPLLLLAVQATGKQPRTRRDPRDRPPHNESHPTFRRLSNSPFLSISGDGCYIEGACLYSHRRRGDLYGINEECTVAIAPGAGPLTVPQFAVEDYYDYVLVNGVEYTDLNAPVGIRPWNQITWWSDETAVRDGWTFCLPGLGEPVDGSATPAPTPVPSVVGGDETTTTPAPSPPGGAGGDVTTTTAGPGAAPGPEGGPAPEADPATTTTPPAPGPSGGEATTTTAGPAGAPAPGPIGGDATTTTAGPAPAPVGDDTTTTAGPTAAPPDDATTTTAGAAGPEPDGAPETTTTPAPTPAPAPQSEVVVGAINGAGGYFDYHRSATPKTIALRACESAHGKDNCAEGQCRCFKYFFRKGSLSCNCGKKSGEYEWVYENTGCTYIHEDYAPGTTAYRAPGGAFVRKRGEDCSIFAWHLMTALDKQLLAHHTVLDLRAADYQPGSPTWDSLVGGVSAPVGGAHYDNDVKAFIFDGKTDGADIIRVPFPANAISLPAATFTCWVRVANPYPTQSANVIMTTSTMFESDITYYSSSPTIGYRSVSIPTGASTDWLHVAVLFYESPRVFYMLVNKQIVGSGYVPGLTPSVAQSVTDALFIGGTDSTESVTQGSYLWVSDVQIFDRILLQTEVNELHRQGRPSGLAAGGDGRICRYPGTASALAAILQAGTDGTGRNHLSCLVWNNEDATPELMEAVMGGATSCAVMTAASNCSVEVTPSEPLRRFCPNSCSPVTPEPGSAPESASPSPSAGPSPSWTTNSGDCVGEGQCAQTPFFPLLATSDQTCSMATASTSPVLLSAVPEFDTGLTVNGVQAMGNMTGQLLPAGAGGSTVDWDTGPSVGQPWKVCLEDEMSAPICHDDANWTDVKYGDGSVTCATLAMQPSWCFLRGPYSREAQTACPRTCNDCMEPFEPVNKSCGSSAKWDESARPDHVSSAWACYWHCIAQEHCTHFEWLPDASCRRFFRCEEEDLRRLSEGGQGSMYVIPKKVERHFPPHDTKIVWKGFVHVITTGICKPEAQIQLKGGCAAAGKAMGLDVATWPTRDWGSQITYPYNCVYKPDTKVLAVEYITSCSQSFNCLCMGRSTPLVAILETVAATNYAVPTRDLEPPMDSPSFSICSISQATRCQGKSRTLRRLELPIRLGPELFPFPVDWDGDGDLDLLLGRKTGELVYLENAGGRLDLSTAVGIAKTTSLGACSQYWESTVEGLCSHWCCHTTTFGDVCFGPGRQDWAGCESSTAWGISASDGMIPIAFDWDNDGDQELLVASCDGTLTYYRNDEGGLNKVTGADNPFESITITGKVCTYPYLVDWDGDGDLDILLGTESGRIKYYENLAGTWSLVTGELDPFNGVKVGEHAVPTAYDWDQDGDVDLILGNKDGTVEYYERSAHGTLVFLYAFEGISFEGKSIPRVVDWDGDGDQDLVLADGATGLLYIYVSESENKMIERLDRANPFDDLEVGLMAMPQIVDWDHNGFNDLVVGQLDGRIDLYAAAEDGTLRLAPDSPFHNLTGVTAGVAQQLVDWDKDGDVDMLVGQEGGEVLFFEHLPSGSFAPYQLLADNASFGTYVTPHAVDWDGDGDLDLLVGDSGEVLRRSFRLASFQYEDWNQWFEEQGSEMQIGGKEVYIGTNDTEATWIIAYCSAADHWFIFEDMPERRSANVAGECRDAKARKPGEFLLDRGALGQPQGWEVHGTIALAVQGSTVSVKGQTVVSDGTVRRPHCDVCNRENPECNQCELSESLRFACATELCAKQGFDTGTPITLTAIPGGLCDCTNNDTNKLDFYGAPCAQYESYWCGGTWYDTLLFKADRDCCLCGGGVHGTGQGIYAYSVQAECLNSDIWVPNDVATVAEVLPEAAFGGSVKFFERTAYGLEEKFGAENPFSAIAVGARPYPDVIDWNNDGRLDLILGIESREVATMASTGTPERPLCGVSPGARCLWDLDTKARCARALCRAAGYASGAYLSGGGELCSATYSASMETFFILDKDDFEVRDGYVTGVSVTARCAQGGIVEYFEQQEDGSLLKMVGEKNPFDTILRPRSAAPLSFDWDADGEYEVVLGDNSGYVRYYELGRPCEQPDPCNDKGLCHPVLGVCNCIAGHILGDCSRCDSSYYSRRALQASVSSCLACPGLTTQTGLCAWRGHCFDDHTAREYSTRSNTTWSLEIGTGECTCNEYYFGTDSLGRSSCSEGACPPGKDPQLDETAQLACQDCWPGTAKAEEGNHACMVCPSGRYSAAGADHCSACPAGRFQQNEEEDYCDMCLPGTFSQNGSSTCPSCPIGRYAEHAALSECPSCMPGQWSEETGSSQCTLCPAGKYGSGLQPCQACDSGSYSETPGQSACTLCEAGRYSPAYEASTSEACLPCDIGRFGSTPGAKSQGNCLACDPGATTADQAATDALLCIQPNKSDDFRCVSGRHCTLSITGNKLQSPHQVAIASSTGTIVSSDTISLPSNDGFAYSWSQPLALDGNRYQLLWCPGIHGTCGVPDFAFTIGELEVTGPAATTFTCIRGAPCENLGPVSGIKLLGADRIQSQASCGSGPPIAITLENTQGYGSNTNVDASGTALTFSFGAEPVSVNPSTDYRVCWCAMGRNQSGGCSTEADFLVVLGILTVEGPRTGHEMTCFLGQDCMLPGVEGVNVMAGDRLMVLDRCGAAGQIIGGVPGGGIAESSDGKNFHFLPFETAVTGDLRVLMSFPGLFRLCFCRSLGGNCTTPNDFQADTGFFTSKGPYSDHQYGCFVGATCNLLDLQGVGLENSDEIRIEEFSVDHCSWEAVTTQATHSKIHVPSVVYAKNRGKDFSLGHVEFNATPGKYRLCWRPSVAKAYAFRSSVGFLFVTCPAGTYRLVSAEATVCEDCPLGAYCTGGTFIGGFEDDSKTRCSAGRTTLQKRSASLKDCLCDAGYFLSEGSVCTACEAGRFKVQIADNTTCPGTCPEGLTTLPGARSADQCFSTAVARTESGGVENLANISTANVYVLEGKLQMPACLPWAQEREARQQLRLSIASSIGVAAADVELEFPEVPSSTCQQNTTSQGARRLQQMQSVVYKISRASQSEADRLSQNVNTAEIQAEMHSTLGITVTVAAPPSVSQQTLNCTLLGEGWAFPPGSRPTSLSECTCSLGFSWSEKTKKCERCGIGLYKSTVGNVQCSLCPTFTGDLRMTTLAEGAAAESFCTCPKGYFAPEGSARPPAACFQCGIGHFCMGGLAREMCPHGTTTSNNASKHWDECICQPGFQEAVHRNATYRCDPCPEGKFKVQSGDQECSQTCRPDSTSDKGAKKDTDCYCKRGFTFLEFSETCSPCPVEGVNCEGGFDPPESRIHKAPMTREGFYLTGYMEAEQCFVNDENGASTCLPGATWENDEFACSGYQTGPVCGACKFGSARDLGDGFCIPCVETWHDWLHIFNLNTDLVIKAAFGIFLGKQAMDSATKTRKMEAVIIRILLQWVTACSVLSTFDLSTVSVFDWSKREMEMAQAQKDDSVAAVSTATGLSFKFQFPPWFQPVWRTIMAITGSLPGPVSPQLGMECLVQRQLAAGPDGNPSTKQLLGPVLWWLFYPISVVIWVAILCIVIAKIIYPTICFVAIRAKRKLTTRLLAAGVTSQTTEIALNKVGAKKIQEIFQDPLCLTSVKGLVERFGGDVYAEAASTYLVEHAGFPMMEMLKTLIDTKGVHPLAVSAAQRVLDGGLEFLGPFIARVISIIGRHKVANTFDDPLDLPDTIFEYIKAMDGAQASHLDATTEGPEKVARFSGLHRFADFADEDEFGEDAVPGMSFDNYEVFGLFQSTRAGTVLRDAFPLYIVTLYSIWDVVTRRFMGVLQVRTLLVTLWRDEDGRERRQVQGRWLYDMRYIVFTEQHTMLALIAMLGLAIWSVGLVWTLFAILKKNRYNLQEKFMIRNFGYFYNGLEPNVFWWEVLVKKADILILYAITFTEVFHDPRAKLIMYLGSAGIFWALHNMYHPYDDRQNMLADRIEDLGLCSRFMTIFILQVLLMMNAQPTLNAIFAILLIAVNAYFLCTVIFVLAIEIPDTQKMDEMDEEEKKSGKKVPTLNKAKTKKMTDKAMKMMGGGSNPIMRVFLKVFQTVMAKIVAPIMAKVLQVGGVVATLKEITASKVPHVRWKGVGHDLVIITHEKENLPWYEKAFAFFVRRLYKLGEQEQKTFVARTIGQFWDYILNNSECHRLPHHIMDIFFVLPDCLRNEKEEGNPNSKVPFHIRVGRRVRFVLLEAKDVKRLSAQAMRGQFHRSMSFKHTELPDFTNCGEDFNAALLFIQRLPRADVHEFLLEALTDSWDDGQDGESPPGTPQPQQQQEGDVVMDDI